ncbi:MAG: cytochrome c biogenesis protein ResB [Propionibacteriaceae bacterium]|jgi:cytochrome c biogenesis protein|nr:cytochrome c biogenesis protein ResB [Propionibacteriaceae bacterium]
MTDQKTTDLPVEDDLPVQEAVPLVEGDGLPDVSVGEFFHRLYQVTYSKTVGLIIILIVTVYVLLGVLFPQASSSVWNDPVSKADFLEAMETRFGGFSSILSFLGLFHVFTSIGFLVAIGALMISILGCTTHRIPQLWKRYKHPRVQVSDRFFSATRYQGSVDADSNETQAISAAKEKLAAARYRVIEGEGNLLYADKYSWGGVGTVIAHLAFILIIVAYIITSLTGYESIITVPAGGGKQIAVGAGTNFTLEATSFVATFDDESGRPLDYVSNLILRDGGVQVAEKEIRVNEPLSYGGYTFHQTTYGLAVEVTIVSRGEVVFEGGVSQDWSGSWNGGEIVGGTVELPELGLYVDVISPRSGVSHPTIQPGQVLFSLMAEDNTPMSKVIVNQGESDKIGDMTLSFDREGNYTGIMVRKDPGALWMLIASILLVTGMMITFMCRHKRLWVRAQDGKLMLASPDKEDSGFRREFNELLTQAETWSTPQRRK